MIDADIQEILERYKGAGRDALIPLLQDVQEAHGYLSKEAVEEIGKHLNLRTSKIYGVATFYNQFRFHPPGKYHIQVCRGTACHVKNSLHILEAVQSALGISAGQTTRDKMFSLEVVACMGACGLSPVICVNGEFYAKVTPAKVKKIIESYRNEELQHEAI